MLAKRVEDDVMQIRSKAYLQFILLWRSFLRWMPTQDVRTPAETSPSLIYIAVVLAFFLAILELDAHRGQLEALGLLPQQEPTQSILLGP